MEGSQLCQWLKDIGLSDYCKLLWEAGFRDLKSVASITEDQLRQAGVGEKKTLNKFMQEFRSLKSDASTCAVTSGQQTSIYPALHDYVGNEDTDLLIKKGDLVVVLESNSSHDKWKGLDVNQKQGFFPPWVVVGSSSLLPIHGMPPDHSQDKTSVRDTEKHVGHDSVHSVSKNTSLQVAGLPEPGGAEKGTLLLGATAASQGNSSLTEVQSSDSISKLANEHKTVTENTAAAVCSEHDGQSNLENVSQDLFTASTTVPDSPREADQPTDPRTGTKEMKSLSPSSAGRDEPARDSQQFEMSVTARSNPANNGTGSTETAGFTKPTETTVCLSPGTATFGSSKEPAKTSSKMPSSTAASAEEAFPQYTGSSPVLHMESSDLFHWLRKIGLADYCTGLWKAGFHNLASVTSLTKDQFKRAGVKNSRICSRLMQECGKLKSEHPTKLSSPHATTSRADTKETSRNQVSKSETTRSQTLFELAEQAKGQKLQSSSSTSGATGHIESGDLATGAHVTKDSGSRLEQSQSGQRKVSPRAGGQSISGLGTASDGIKGDDVPSDACASGSNTNRGHRALPTPAGSSENSLISKKHQSNPSSSEKVGVTSSPSGNVAGRTVSREPAKKKPKHDKGSTGKSNVRQTLHSKSVPEGHKAKPQQQAGISSRPPPEFQDNCLGVTVEFHVIVHDEWEVHSSKGGKSVHIRFGTCELGGWHWDCVDMKPVEFVGATKHMLMIGSFIIPTAITHKMVPYKYTVRTGKKMQFREMKYEFVVCGSHGGIVNRALIIPEHLRGKSSGLYRKYDDVIRIEPGIFRQLNPFAGSQFVENRIWALEAMLPRWPGFCGREKASQMHRDLTAEEALRELQNVVTSIRVIPVWEDNQPENAYIRLTPNGFTDQVIAKAIQKHIRPQLEALIKGSKEEHGTVLSSAVALSVLVSSYKLDLDFKQLIALLKALMIHPHVESRRCVDYDFLMAQIQDTTKAAMGVEHVIRKAWSRDYSRCSEWLLALPVLHFLQRSIHPFHFPEAVNPKFSQWWGLENLMKGAREYRKRQTSSRSPLFLAEELKPICAADRLTARAFLHSLTLEQLSQVRVETVAGHPSEFIQALEEKLTDIPIGFSPPDTTVKILNSLLTYLMRKSAETEVMDTDIQLAFTKTLSKCGVTATVQLLQTIATRWRSKQMLHLLQLTKEIVFGFMHQMTTYEVVANPSGSESKSERDRRSQKQVVVDFTRSHLEETFKIFAQWLDLHFLSRLRSVESLGNELTVWDKILQTHALPESLQQLWGELALKNIRRRVQQVDETTLVEGYCQFCNSDLHPVIVQCIEDLSEKSVDRLIKHKGGQKQAVGSLIKKFITQSKPDDHSSKLLKMILLKSCPKSAIPDGWMEWFEHLLSWPLWTSFLQLTDDARKSRDLLGEGGHLVSCAESVLRDTECCLTDGSITVGQIHLLKTNFGRFLDLCKLWDSHQNSDKRIGHQAEASMRRQSAELMKFEKERLLIDNFLSACSIVSRDWSEDLKELSQKIREDVSSKQVKDLRHQNEEETALQAYFPVPSTCRQFLQPLWNARNSDIFKRLWNDKSREVSQQRLRKQPPNTQPLTLAEIASMICGPVYVLWQRLCAEVQDGSISLTRVSTLFGHLTNNSEAIVKELSCIDCCSPQRKGSAWKSKRKEQIEQYFKLREKINAARTLKLVIGVLELNHSFVEVDSICQQDSPEFRQQSIDALSDELLSAGRFLATFTSDRISCLESFACATNLIQWLRKEIREWKELETFVELAGTKSSEEGDLETVKVTHLHAACAGFAPLLFDLHPDVTFIDLQQCCEKVFASFDRDRELTSKWLSTSKCLEEFKITRASLSSVEVSSFSQLEMINSRGRYHVGCLKDTGSSLLSVLTTEDCVKLVIESEGEETAGAGKVYRLNDLLDLQSKLMLISGHGDKTKTDQVDVYIEVLDRVIRLAKIFIEIGKAGHDKYLTWKLDFRCTKGTGSRYRGLHNADVRIREVHQLLSRLDTKVQQLTAALQSWSNEVDGFRVDYYYLNCFTTPQLLILRQQLGLLMYNRQYRLPGDVFALLGAVNPTCSQQDILQIVSLACDSALHHCHWQESPPLYSGSSLSYSESNIRDIAQRGFSFDAAVKALKASNGDLSTAIALCVQHRPTLHEIRQDQDHDSTHAVALSMNQGLPSVSSIETEVLSEPVTYLSLDILGKTLQQLAASSPNNPERTFPTDQFRLGEPNLVVVPQNEIFLGILCLYMRDPQLSLPSAQEVLLCSSSTRLEEVCLFWRRVLGDPDHRRLFCLAMADSLSYDVSRKSWEEFNRLAQKRHNMPLGAAYKLVIICKAETEDKSYLVDALDPYRRACLPLPALAQIRSYLKRKFQLTATHSFNLESQPAPAASLDYEGSSVRLVRSSRAGDGKSSFINGIAEGLTNLAQNRLSNSLPQSQDNQQLHIVVPLHDQKVEKDAMMETLRPMAPCPDNHLERLIHIDILSASTKGLDTFLFSLLILGEVSDSEGYVWRKHPNDLYVIEMTSPAFSEIESVKPAGGDQDIVKEPTARKTATRIPLTNLLPTVSCGSPAEAQEFLSKGNVPRIGDPDIDDRQFQSQDFQRAFQYLDRAAKGINLDLFKFNTEGVEGDHLSCLQTLQSSCGIPNPSWAEIKYFVNFLSRQLCDCENNDFCNPDTCGEDLPGFKAFVLKLMFHMSRDFSTPSLDYQAGSNLVGNEIVQLRRRWEHSSHPYLFFNEDRHTITFVEVQVTKDGRLLDPKSGQCLETIMSRDLSTALYTQGFRLQENYDNWSKARKLEVLCRVMGVNSSNVHDPDETYELTMDNVKKILAIQMRFRCGIPVIIMGETGCGKTRLIRYMCALQSSFYGAKNMLLMKVHGGITRRDIINKVKEAEILAIRNNSQFGEHKIQTVLFFDEANTTDALGLIKEIMCDKRVNGKKVEGLGSSLHVIAACNPYRKHSLEMIERLEAAGLGYHVKSNETEDKLGHIPLRQLVYRVHALPDSMKALVWDFGQLDSNVERLYVKQIVHRHVGIMQSIPNSPVVADIVTNVLAAAQGFMRQQNDECSFVSLRDVERAMIVLVWFYNLTEILQEAMVAKHLESLSPEDTLPPLDSVTRALVLALGVCYQARLHDRRSFLNAMVVHFRAPCPIPGGVEQLSREIKQCQEVFLDELELPPQIARNHALSENVFMMVVCINLRIPLFLVGKPGSSKSLAKDVVKNAMKGQLSSSKLFQSLKQLHMVSYQCSPLSTADGIIGAFQQCQRAQRERDMTQFVACVVLDEVGLAEDSPRLPLKALHPLLDDGTAGADDTDEDTEQYNRVAFVGLSNWALDPAKMNRGILVNREVPDDKELTLSARGICGSADATVQNNIDRLVDGMADAYRLICSKQKREFFGLRDFYSLIKMVCAFSQFTRQLPTWNQLEHVVRRNFGGQENVDVVEIFRRCCPAAAEESGIPSEDAIDNSAVGLIRANLQKKKFLNLVESRYLLLLTKNYAALNIIRQRILADEDPVIIFGSSFPKDQEYTQVCRTINRIKVCMATGRTVVLLNLDRLYESLYDALNQYYVYHGGQRFVDLGLGNHRVKCQVHKDFRLILVAEREVVYNEFPIPLINRMEKHFIAMESVLSPKQEIVVREVNTWAKQFAEISPEDHFLRRGEHRPTKFGVSDAFVGFNPDAAATLVLQACRRNPYMSLESKALTYDSNEWIEHIFDISVRCLLSCATPDAVARLHVSSLSTDARKLWDIYFCEQHHSSLLEFLGTKIADAQPKEHILLQVTTHSRLLSSSGVSEICSTIGMETESIFLQQFDTEQQFEKCLAEFYELKSTSERVLLVQCEAGDMNSELVSCARYLIQERRNFALSTYRTVDVDVSRRHLVFIIQLPRVAGHCFVGFQGGAWTEVHIDELRPANQVLTPSITSLVNRKISSLLGAVPEPNSFEPVIETTPDDTGEEPGEGDGTCTRQPPILNAEAVLRACIHGAVSRLDDREESVDNASMRIHILLQLIPDDTRINEMKSKRFYEQLKWQVVRLLQERDRRMEVDAATRWVRNEALSHSSLQAGGTFRRALWLRVLNTVTPILAEIIAFLDRNCNLKLISDAAAGKSSWLSDLWLDIFNSSLVRRHRFDFMSPVQCEVSQKVRVYSSGFRDHLFQAKFPFSFLVKLELDGLLLEAKRMARERHEKVHVVLQRLFDGSELGAIILRESSKNDPNSGREMVHRYFHDFVHMVYHASSAEEYKLVESAILCGLWELVSTGDESKGAVLPLKLTLPAIHAAFEHAKSRLSCFGDIVGLHPEIVPQLHQQLVSQGELLTDVMATHLLLELLSPAAAVKDAKQRSQWLRKVQKAKPVVESCLAFTFPGEIRNALCRANRNCWSLCSAVRLFVEHIQTLVQDSFVVDAISTLYQCIKDHDFDFTKASTMIIIQRFLNECSKEYASKLFGPNGEDCRICLSDWISRHPVVLPCRHIFCHSCLEELLKRSQTCPVCIRNIPPNIELALSDELVIASETFRSFKRCSTAFFMELVSVHSFSDEASLPPERELVRMLMELVAQGPVSTSTRPFSPFNEDAIDPRPVVRSFILQLLLKYSLPATLEYVEMVFANARGFIRTDNMGDLEDLSVLFVDCMEDSMHQRSFRSTVDERLSTAVAELKQSKEKLLAQQFTVDHLQGVAGARFGISVTAEALGNLTGDDESALVSSKRRDASSLGIPSTVIHPSVRQLLFATKVIIRDGAEPQLGLFLLKQLVRNKGLDILHKLQEQYGTEMQWLSEMLQGDTSEPAMPDYFVVLGEPYKRLREAVARTIVSCDARYIDDLMKEATSCDKTSSFLLAIYGEITSCRALAVDRQIPARTLTLIKEYCNQSALLPSWANDLANDLISNTQGRSLAELQVSPGRSGQTRSLAGLALHVLITISSSDREGLVQPLRSMLTQPRDLANSYWPTMPEDYYMEAKNLVEGTKWYECKNGHPYLVLNCGKPAVTLRCPDCGENIGMNTTDQDAREQAVTQTGHMLGPASRRSQDAAPERDLSAPACALVRLLMHSVLVWASCSRDQNVRDGVAEVVKPPLSPEDLPAFFWSHFELDTRLFAKAIGRSVEDAVVVCHKFLERITNIHDTLQDRFGDGLLVSMEERNDWEAAFSKKFIAPLFQEMQTKMTDWLQEVMKDQKLGNNPVIRRVYELEHPAVSSSSPRLWRYRVRASIDHLTHTLEQNMSACEPDQCRLLREFLKQEPKLRALQYLPDVVKLQRLLMDKYDRLISQQEAKTFPVGTFLNKMKDREELLMFENLIESFNLAWGLVREHVLSHGRLKPKKKEHELVYVYKETALAYLLPRTVDEGTCATALVDYLVNSVHNEFLLTYCRVSGHEWEPERVTIDHITRAHLVAYDVQRELMPLVLAHCDYSLSVGEGTNITYNLPALERQISDRFITGKAHVEMKDYRLAFRKDVYDSSLFVRLKERIPQVELPLLLQRQITSEFHDLTDVYSVLAVLEIVIRLILSAGGSSDTLLHEYIHETLEMRPESGLVSRGAQQHCRLKHVVALWRLLTLEKGRRLSLANQEPFEHVSSAYRQEMDIATLQALEKALRKLNVDAFLLELADIIALELQRWEETPNMDQYELRLAMQELYGSVLHGLDHIPSQVQLKHLLHCWKVAVKFESDLASTR